MSSTDEKVAAIVSTGLQVAYLGAVSNILAQWIATYQGSKNVTFTSMDWGVDWLPIIQFMLFLFLTTPHNFLWQEFLENTFPAHPSKSKPATPAPQDEKKDTKEGEKAKDEEKPKEELGPLSIRNTIIKLLLDQTLGAAFNTIVFSLYFHSLRLATPNAPRRTNPFRALTYWTTPGAVDFTKVDFGKVLALSEAEFWPMLQASWRFWPMVSAVNYSFVKSVETRNLVGAFAGLIWGVYISMLTGA